MLLPSLAKKIIQEVRKLIDEDIIIVDTSGTIIASTNADRLGAFHEGALLASRRQSGNLIITTEMEKSLRGVKSGINLPVQFQNKVVGVIGITGEPENVSHYGELLKKMTELLIQESYYAEQIEWGSRVLEAFVFDWLHSKEFTSEFRNRADVLGIDLSIGRQVILVQIDTSTNSNERSIWNQFQQRNHSEDINIYVRWGNNRLLLIFPEQPKKKLENILQQLKSQMEIEYDVLLSFGVGKVVFAHHILQSFNQAERALIVAKRNNTITFDDELKLEMLLQEISQENRQEFINRTIGTLLSEKVLIETLQTFINENQSIKNTADFLHIHVNTLHYRLKKVEEMTGLDPRSFVDLSTLHISLLFLEQHPKI
ncbi:CdaR family transcriptional regulator [Ferdinandcohnia quinoae]|uniref:Helix-turn-helix domain-containing protein n=1 Tax=Fredinandcohnia quinoae TaxID=2918902 RepID=A0AAW5E7T6_9BACI|nr:sugar diacid recognition domain-containing protein [Fredinandcohnia sp. SECRCQ15]MCH1626989.1 helix-turn-helix domain-containing protein [Fredinandcohnia sp. SECRCQ15]